MTALPATALTVGGEPCAFIVTRHLVTITDLVGAGIEAANDWITDRADKGRPATPSLAVERLTVGAVVANVRQLVQTYGDAYGEIGWSDYVDSGAIDPRAVADRIRDLFPHLAEAVGR